MITKEPSPCIHKLDTRPRVCYDFGVIKQDIRPHPQAAEGTRASGVHTKRGACVFRGRGASYTEQ